MKNTTAVMLNNTLCTDSVLRKGLNFSTKVHLKVSHLCFWSFLHVGGTILVVKVHGGLACSAACRVGLFHHQQANGGKSPASYGQNGMLVTKTHVGDIWHIL